MSTPFTGHEERWQARLGKLRDVVRQELVARQLTAELRPPPVRIIDLGCGQGTQALALARRGYEVTGVDASAELLARFERDLAAEPAEVRARVRVERGLIEDWAERSGVSRAEAVLCHGVLMYAADPDPLLRAVAGLTAPGGMASLLVRNGDGLAMRPGLLGNWAACAEALSISGGSVTYANRIGVTARADRLADLTARLAGSRAGRHRLVRRAGVHRHRARRRRTAAGPGGPAGLRGTGRAHRPLPPGGRPAARDRQAPRLR